MSITTLPTPDELERIPTLPYEPSTQKEDEVTVTLRKMRQLLEHNWTRGAMRDSHGRYCLVGAAQIETVGVIRDLDATIDTENIIVDTFNTVKLFVHAGFIYSRVLSNRHYRRVIRALKHQGGFLTVIGLIKFNDHSKKSQVLHLIDKTIEARTR